MIGTRVLQNKSSTVEALVVFIADMTTPAGLKTGMIRTGKQGESEDMFEEELKLLEIYNELTPSGTLHYNDVVERTLDRLKKRSVTMLGTVKEVHSPKLCVKSTTLASEMSNVSPTSEIRTTSHC